MTSEISIPKNIFKAKEILEYLDAMPNTWYWTLYPFLFTFDNEADEIIFRLKFEI